MSVSERMAVTVGDITRLEVDAVVNAANSRLVPGGGVDGALNRAAGPKLAEAMAAVAAEQGGCPTGQAVITPGFALPAAWVIHAVGPRWHGGTRDEPALLAGAYRSALEIAAARRLGSLAFPSISTGVYGYPPAAAAAVAVDTVADWLAGHAHPARVVFCAFDAATEQLYRDLLAQQA